jgi:hypothetical protein
VLPATTWDFDPNSNDNRSVEFRLRERCWSLTEPVSSVIILVMAHPDSYTARQLMNRNRYFDIRSGGDWDVFFPGYYQYGSMADPLEIEVGDQYWGFSPRAFDRFRRDLERRCGGHWRYSGESELLAVNAILTNLGPTVDFPSIISGPLTEPDLAVTTRTLAQAIERLSQTLDHDSPSYAIPEVLGDPRSGSTRKGFVGRIGIGAAGGVAAALIRHALGLP